MRSAVWLPFLVHIVVGHFEDREVVGWYIKIGVGIEVAEGRSLFKNKGVFLSLVIKIRGSPNAKLEIKGYRASGEFKG